MGYLNSRIIFISLLFFAGIIDHALAQDDIVFSCEEGWTLFGTRCYKVFPVAMSWNDAERTCHNYGSHLVNVFGFTEHQQVAELAADADTPVQQYWIGLNRQNLDDPDDADDLSASWSNIRGRPPTPSSLRLGYWYVNQPDPEDGACVYVLQDGSYYYGGGWRLGNCLMPKPFVCESQAGLEGFYRCATGRYIPNTDNFICDGENDCGDSSDEIDCECRYLVETEDADSGAVSSNSPYAANSDCLWTIAAPVGSRISIEFTKFKTEKDADQVQIWVGGKTERQSRLIGQLSGILDLDSIPEFHSSNNFLLVKFHSDGSFQNNGFSFTWTTEPQYNAGIPTELEAMETAQTFQSPNYGSLVKANERERWIISVPTARRVISLQVLDFDLPECGELQVYDGSDFTSALLYTLTSDTSVQTVVSTDNVISLYYQTCGEIEDGRDYTGFQISYQIGCGGEVMANQGHVISPGYLAEQNYPNFQECTWLIKSETGDQITAIFRDDFDLQENMDFLSVYDAENASGLASYNLTGSTLPEPITSEGGHLFLKLSTNSITNGRGFYMEFSIDCPELHFNNATIVEPEDYSRELDGEVLVLCHEGHVFAQEEHVGEVRVLLRCMMGEWNVSQTPQCERVWCGQAPAVMNGNYMTSTGSQYQDTVSYACLPGFEVVGNDTVECSSDGSWTAAPTCVSSTCPEPENITDGTYSVVNGTGTSFSSVLEFECDPGYELVGAPRLYCDEVWSDDFPTCARLPCPIEALAEHFRNGNLSPTANVSFSEMVEVECDSGFILEGTNGSSEMLLECLANQTFDARPRCVDENECLTANGGCQDICTNTIGSYNCSCGIGYETDENNSSLCTDIDECEEDGIGYRFCQGECENTNGSYVCLCNDTQILYTGTGNDSFFESFPLEGRRDLIGLYINHSCIPVECEMPIPPNNSQLLSTNTRFVYEDKAQFACDLGYVPTEVIEISCEANGEWSVHPDNITCDVATCKLPELTDLMYAPEELNDTVLYGEEAIVTCLLHRPEAWVVTRKCQYDSTSNTYELYLNDSSVECPIIDCGVPNLPQNSRKATAYASTTYSSSFQIECQDLYEQDGNTSLANSMVMCGADGRWDFGTFECYGKACPDPGTQPGAIQVPMGTYEPGEVVEYLCNRTGFTLEHNDSLTCTITVTNTTWDYAAPSCIDTTAPVISREDNLCDTVVEIDYLTVPGFVRPTVTDNTGATQDSGIIFNLTSLTNTAGLEIALADENSTTYFTYEAEDFAGNQASCTIGVKIKDRVAPVVTCPLSYTYYLASSTAANVSFPEDGNKTATYSDDQAVDVVSYSPEYRLISEDDVGSSFMIEVTVEDSAGNSASCTYMINVEAAECSDLVLDDPYNGQTSCVETGDGFSCNMTCNAGYYFYEQSDNGVLVDSLSYSCTVNGTGFDVDTMPDCVSVIRAGFYFTYELEYDSGDNSPTCLEDYSEVIVGKLPAVAAFVQEECIDGLEMPEIVVEYVENSTAVQYITNKVFAEVSFKITPDELDDNTFETCVDLVNTFFEALLLDIQDNLETIEPTNTTCSTLVALEDYFELVEKDVNDGSNKGDFICDAAGTKRVDVTDNHMCLLCPPGQYYDADTDTCTVCPLGEYQEGEGATECTPCEENTYTYSTGSRRETNCMATCATISGFVSLDGNNLPPCVQCGLHTYSNYTVDSNTCSSCPVNTITQSVGASGEEDCMSQCQSGYYSNTGFEPCTPCPVHFYNDAIESKVCQACDTDQITLASGANDSSLCVDGAAELCTNTTCSNGGTCTVDYHHVMCECPEGYTGLGCETMINYCSSSPCYAGTCFPTLGGYNCTCPNGNYSGDRCETDPDNCDPDPCENGGMCFDEEDIYQCLCPVGYSGDRCETTEEICVALSCEANSTCTAITNRRRMCNCSEGWTGDDCGINIDECESNPCLYGFACIDGDNGYMCACDEDNFSGINCEERTSFCDEDPCGATGECYDDFRTNSFICVCYRGYEPESSNFTGTDPWYGNVQDISVNAQCVRVDYCEEDPCMNGTCSNDALDRAVCDCDPGYTGYRCQRNIDDCQEDPCVHGRCMDEVDGYTCDCRPGFTGTECETDIDDCEANPCNETGTDQSRGDNGCVDREDDFECFCEPGYRGRTCETEIDECFSSPCLHRGSCEDEIDGFHCDCVEGWEGDRCEDIADYCGDDLCENDAECQTIFGNHKCRCEYPYYGESCELEASTCRDANPCVNNIDSCTEDEMGVAACNCSGNFSGNFCQLAVDYCEIEGFCQHGGECESSLDGFDCLCLSDFYGSRCEESTDDCDGVSCDNDGTCVDGVGRYFCQCPFGSEGPECDRDTDRDWDIYLASSDGSAMAYTRYPFDMGSLEEFSIAFRVKFAQESGEGVVFTLYGVPDGYLQSPKVQLLQLDESGVTVTFPDSPQVTEDFDPYDINDGTWYFITVTWLEEAGSLQVFINSIRVIDLEIDARLSPCLGLIVLGSPLREPSSSDLEPERGESFHGYVSRVFVWDVALSFNGEIPFLTDSPDNLVREENIQIDWSSMFYQIESGVQVLPSSSVGETTCAAGFTGDDCDEELPDKESPTVSNCPNAAHFTVADGERYASLTWMEPDFEGYDGTPVALIERNRILTPGRYHNAYVAYDNASNAAVCMFDIYVKLQDCEDPTIPSGVNATCEAPAGAQPLPFRTCTPSCEQTNQQFSVAIPTFFTCGPEGSFNVFQAELPFEYPQCSGVTTQTVDVLIQFEYLNIVSCSSLQQVDSFGIEIRERMQILDGIWKTPGDLSTGAFCQGLDCAEAIIVETNCVENEARKRKKRATTDALVTVTIYNMVDPIFNEDTNETLSVEEVLLSDILDDGGLTFSDTIPNANPDEPSLIVLVVPSCPEGSALTDNGCVECTSGTFYDSTSKACVECRVGEYQENEAQLSCEECPENKTTQTTGTTELNLCFDICEPGSRFDIDVGSCVECARGYYQPEEGQFFCYACVADNTTAEPGSVSQNDCYGYCGSGTELAEDGTCAACEVGYYRTAPDHDECMQCNNSMVTPGIGAESVANCTVPNCEAGTRIVDQDCEECAVGTYQPHPYQTDCLLCDANTTTLNTSSTAAEDCLFFCPLGAEETDDAACEPCEVGFYKNNSLPGQVCQSCPLNYVTNDTGSTGMEDCSILACLPGTKANANNTECIPCERGSYQSESNQDECEPCPDGQSTREEGADSDSDCVDFCADGLQSGEDSECEPCPRGYYRNVSEMGEFSKCQICPDQDFITNGTGSTSVADCNISNCSSGYYLTQSNKCEACPLGYYQPDRWQTECEECPGQRTTDQTASQSQDECRLECEVGFEDRNTGECEECERGYYKAIVGATRCTECDDEYITVSTGATSEDNCTIANCQPGSYRNTSSNQCVVCPRGTFESQEWQEDSCQPCDDGETTLDDGAVSSDSCVLNCDDGEGYNLDSAECVPCPQGYYRTQGQEDVCEKCPENLVTDGTGAFSASDCNLGNCTAGFYQDGTECEPCPRGQFQSQRWSSSCEECPDGQTTTATASVQDTDCFDIPPPIYIAFTIKLELTFLVEYRDVASAEYQDLVSRILAAVTTILTERTTSYEGGLEVKDLVDGSVLVLLNGLFENTTIAGVGGNLTSMAELESVIQAEIDTGTLGGDSTLITDPTYQLVTSIDPQACSAGEGFVLATGDCQSCGVAYYQPTAGTLFCQPCPDGFITAGDGTVSEDDCYHPSDCGVVPDLCARGDGEMCDTATQRCTCRSGWTGTYPNCTHKCDLVEYCEHDGVCEGQGTDDVICDCSDTNYEGEFCQTRKDPTTYTNAIIGGAIGGGLGLILLVMIIAACCYGCRKETTTPVQYEQKTPSTFGMPLYGTTTMGYNASPPTGVIVRPGSMYGAGTTLPLPMMVPNDGQQSLPGYLGSSGGTNTFVFYDDMDERQRYQYY